MKRQQSQNLRSLAPDLLVFRTFGLISRLDLLTFRLLI